MEQVAVGHVNLEHLETSLDVCRAPLANWTTTSAMSAADISRGMGESRSKGMGLGARGCQPPLSRPREAPPRHGKSVEALRPAWASWMPGKADWALMKAVIRLKAWA